MRSKDKVSNAVKLGRLQAPAGPVLRFDSMSPGLLDKKSKKSRQVKSTPAAAAAAPTTAAVLNGDLSKSKSETR
jgi:hypothetical protein